MKDSVKGIVTAVGLVMIGATVCHGTVCWFKDCYKAGEKVGDFIEEKIYEAKMRKAFKLANKKTEEYES